MQDNEWLPRAKSLPVNARIRVRHGRETRDNMTIANEPDRWWCYCQKCKRGRVVLKESARLLDRMAVPNSLGVDPPTDMQRLSEREYAWLVKRGIWPEMTSNITFSPSRGRIVYTGKFGLMGRDITGRSQQKWLTYHGQHWECPAGTSLDNLHGTTMIVTEDVLSMEKVNFALRQQGNTEHMLAVCSLGTQAHDSLFVELLRCKRVVVFYDNDAPGHAGSDRLARRLRSCGQNVAQVLVSEGDPKDAPLYSIWRALSIAA